MLDHFLEVLGRKPGALPGSSALAQARSGGGFTAVHERFWQRARSTRCGGAAGAKPGRLRRAARLDHAMSTPVTE